MTTPEYKRHRASLARAEEAFDRPPLRPACASVGVEPAAWLVSYEYLAGVSTEGRTTKRTWLPESFVTNDKQEADEWDGHRDDTGGRIGSYRNKTITPRTATPPAAPAVTEGASQFEDDTSASMVGRHDAHPADVPFPTKFAWPADIAALAAPAAAVPESPAAADTTMWAVRITGPDDLYAAPDRQVADAVALVLNRQFARHPFPSEVRVTAEVVAWPHGYESWSAQKDLLQLEVQGIES